MARFSSRSRRHDISAWPGWVDALSSLIMVVIFLLMVFVVGQVFSAAALNTRDRELGTLSGKLAELNDLLAMEKAAKQKAQVDANRLGGLLADQTNAKDLLEKKVAADRATIELQAKQIISLQSDLKTLRELKDRLEGDVAALARLREELTARIASAESSLSQREAALGIAQKGLADKDKLMADRDKLLTDKDKLLAEGSAALKEQEDRLRLSEEEKRRLLEEMGALRDRSQVLTAQLADTQEKTMLAQKALEEQQVKVNQLNELLAAAQMALSDEQKTTLAGRSEIAALNQQIAALREQLAKIGAALDVSEKKSAEQKVQIVDLGKRLNEALASKVQELARYRSEFFGRVREALGERPDIRIVGDRFVFQSELLFPTAAATLEPAGREQLAKLARSLIEIAQQMPPDINWVLRVDGHTDQRRIATAAFPSNWELSTARATSVVKFLIEQGIPAERLAAAGFAEFQPLEPGKTEEAMARNRRIELKFDQR